MSDELYNQNSINNVGFTGKPVMEHKSDCYIRQKNMVKKKTKHLQNLHLETTNPLKKFDMDKPVCDNFRLQRVDFTKYLSQPDNVMEKLMITNTHTKTIV